LIIAALKSCVQLCFRVLTLEDRPSHMRLKHWLGYGIVSWAKQCTVSCIVAINMAVS